MNTSLSSDLFADNSIYPKATVGKNMMPRIHQSGFSDDHDLLHRAATKLMSCRIIRLPIRTSAGENVESGCFFAIFTRVLGHKDGKLIKAGFY